MLTSSAASICFKFSSSIPHMLDNLSLSTGVKEIWTAPKERLRGRELAAQRVRQGSGDEHVGKPPDQAICVRCGGNRKIHHAVVVGAPGQFRWIGFRRPLDKHSLAGCNHGAAGRPRLAIS